MKTDVIQKPDTEAITLDPQRVELPVSAWQALCDDALDPNPFFGPQFLRPFLHHMGGSAVRLVVVREKRTGRWLLAAPVGRRPAGLALPVATAWTSDYAPLGAPLMHPDAREKDVTLFFKAAAGVAGVLAIPYLPLASQTAQRLMKLEGVQAFVTLQAQRAAHASGAEGEQQLEEAYKGKRRKEMRRLLRRLEDHGPVAFACVTGPAVPESFEAFLDLEASGWKGHGQSALKSKAQTAAFSREAIAALAQNDRIRIDQLRAGDRVIASLVSFIEGGDVFTWKIAFDESFARYSPGAQLAIQAFRENLAHPGFRQADSLAIPGHSMIEPLWRGRLETGTLLLTSGPLSSLKRQICAADIALEKQLRGLGRTVKAKLKSRKT
ncbi:GNAT family N-acetyltransferase [Roseibium sp. MMSF_3544]|uniref:GNAT family N-acetyltransferase n=1 Tax=unclassified Roseibium TaxID=2629323 RepID=UPI00273F88EA|nr:GNAT family N-acetyltransferase [Roseibium sp. MMSF_3544]